jgi:cell division septal protein FtsQ
LVGVAAGSAFGVTRIGDAVERSQHLPLRTVAIVGVDGDRAAEVRAYAELSTDGVELIPWFGVDLEAAATRVEQHPFVREAVARRVPPDAIEIAVTLREPRAILRQDDRLYLIDDDGVVMKRLRSSDAADLPVISLVSDDAAGDGAVVAGAVAGGNGGGDTRNEKALANISDALHVIDSAADVGLGDRLSEVNEIPGAGFEVILDDGARARLGTRDIDGKLRRLVAAEKELKAKGRSFAFMWLDDARRPERIAVRLRPETETSKVGG